MSPVRAQPLTRLAAVSDRDVIRSFSNNCLRGGIRKSGRFYFFLSPDEAARISGENFFVVLSLILQPVVSRSRVPGAN
jgi:hypothetical protein